MPAYQIKRGNEIVTEVFAKGTKVEAIMDETVLSIQFSLPAYEEFKFKDTVTIDGLKFNLNSEPLFRQISAHNWEYNLQFQAEHYDLNKVQLMGLDSANQPTETEFAYTGTALGLIDLIVLNVNRVYPTWTRGIVDETPIETFEFSGDKTCRFGLTQLSERYGIEFWFEGKTIHFTKQGQNTGLVFKYGLDNGLREVEKQDQDNNFATRVYIEGSKDNLIPSSYGFDRLQLANGLGYIEDQEKIDRYGLIEGTIYFEDIKPQRTGTASSVTDHLTTFVDSTLDFDINDARVSNDIDPKVVFKTGLLAGLAFDIESYDNATKTIKIIPNEDNLQGVLKPSTETPIESGVAYTLIDINMPESYINAAESQLQTVGQDFYEKNSDPKVKYRAPVDPIYLLENNISLALGDYVTIEIPEAGVSKLIRIIRKTVPLESPIQIEIELAESVSISGAVRNVIKQMDIEKQVGRVTTEAKQAMERARNTTKSLNQLTGRIFDPDGNLAKGDETLYAGMAKIGFDSQNYSLIDVVIAANFNGNPNSLLITSGTLVHYFYEIPGLGYQWQMGSNSWTSLDPNKFYYVYAKCSKNSLNGTWEISETPIFTNDIPDYWAFNLGQLFEVNEDGYRDFEFTKGMTYIVGDQIKTGRVQSIDGVNYLDLTYGKFNLGFANSGLDWDVTNENRLTIRGGITQNSGGITAPIVLYRGNYDNSATYYKGDSVSYQGSKWVYKYETPVSGIAPESGEYWSLEVSKGDDGVNGVDGTNGTNGTNGVDGNYTEFRFNKNGSTSIPPTIDKFSDNPPGWTTSQPEINVGEYMYITSAIKSASGSLVTEWSDPVRFTAIDGKDGLNGQDGINGPFLTYRGEYDNQKTYIGNENRIEGVKYLGSWYVTKIDSGSFSGILPTDPSKWNPFGGQFESVATDLLFATLAYIENLGVRNLATDDENFKRVVIDGILNNIRVYDAQNRVLIELDDDSAFEGTYISDNPPPVVPGGGFPKDYIGSKVINNQLKYIYAVLGPGQSIGISPTDANGYTVFGRKQIATNGTIMAGFDVDQQSFMTSTGIRTSGTLNVGGVSTLDDVNIIDDITIGGDLAITGNITASGSPGITGKVRYLDQVAVVGNVVQPTYKYLNYVRGIFAGVTDN